MFKKIDHIELVPSDVQKTLAFYTEVFGFRVRNRYPVPKPPMREVIYLELGNTVLELISVDGPMPRQRADWPVGYRAIALEVEDMAQAVAHLEQRGVRMTLAPVDLGDSWRGETCDPDGLTIELRQWKAPPADPGPPAAERNLIQFDNPFAESLGLLFDAADGKESRCRLPIAPRHLNPHRVVHGAVLYAMADIGMADVVFRTLAAGEMCATIEIKMTYFKAVGEGELTCHTRLVNRGKRIAYLESSLHCGELLLGRAVGTYAIFRPSQGAAIHGVSAAADPAAPPTPSTTSTTR